MKEVRITPDLSVTDSSARIRCDCGWEDKAYLRDAERKATAHLGQRHNGGRVIIGRD